MTNVPARVVPCRKPKLATDRNAPVDVWRRLGGVFLRGWYRSGLNRVDFKKKPLAAKTQAVEKGAPEVAMLKLSGLTAPITGNRHRVEPASAFQTLLYPTAGKLGENSLAIEIGLADSDRFRQMAMNDEAPASIKKLFPGVKMVTDTAIHQNGYGQFGVATGTLGKSGGACVYAWQAVKDPRAFKTAVSLSDKSELELPVRVTLRYCDVKAKPEQLADMMRTLSIRSVTSRNLDLLR